MEVKSFFISSSHNQQLLGNSEGTRHVIVHSSEKPFNSRCFDGQGLVVHGCQPSPMDADIINWPNVNVFIHP